MLKCCVLYGGIGNVSIVLWASIMNVPAMGGTTARFMKNFPNIMVKRRLRSQATAYIFILTLKVKSLLHFGLSNQYAFFKKYRRANLHRNKNTRIKFYRYRHQTG